MKAIITEVKKETLPQYSAAEGKDVPTVCVVTTVEFYKDDETLYHTQTYAQKPEDVDAENPRAYFDKQAESLQTELDAGTANVSTNASSALADQIIEKLK